MDFPSCRIGLVSSHHRGVFKLLHRAKFFANEVAWFGRSMWRSHGGKAGSVAPSLGHLESRMLLSATPAASLVESTSANSSVGESQPNADGNSDGDSEFDANGKSGQVDGTIDDGTELLSRASIDRHSVVFVDPSVSDHEQFRNGLETETGRIDVHVLSSQTDGVSQISEHLRNYSDIDAIHIIAHGTDGGVKLGDGWLDSRSLEAYSAEIVGWRGSLAIDADLLIYSCDFAASSAGRQLAKSLHELTGADFAASDDLTGHQSLGGDWILEFEQGNVETPVIISTDIQSNWHSVLTPVVVDTVNDVVGGDTSSIAALHLDKGPDGQISLREAIIATNNTPNGATPDEIHFDIAGSGATRNRHR